MKEGYTTMKDAKGISHETPIIKAPYLNNLLNKTIEVAFSDRSCKGVFEGQDQDFISIVTKEGQELISKHSIKRIVPIYVQSEDAE
jgi:sRNA-binding regulator protein Hfq